jgi:AbrB family looped-hinge helix DNA binding protein
LKPYRDAPIILTDLGKKDKAVRITSKGQVTIPQELRERTGLMPGTDVVFEFQDGGLRLVKARRGTGSGSARKTRGEKLVDRLRGAGDFGMSTDEILALMRGPRADEDVPPGA